MACLLRVELSEWWQRVAAPAVDAPPDAARLSSAPGRQSGRPAGGGCDDPMGPIATRLRLPVQVQDAVLAVSVALFQLLGTYRATANQPGAHPLGDPAGLCYLLRAAGGLILLVRRRWPVAVFLTTTAIGLVYYAAG
jgi:hypothetical protein